MEETQLPQSQAVPIPAPPGIQHAQLNVPTGHASPVAGGESLAQIQSATVFDGKYSMDVAKEIHKYVREQIVNADKKAGFFFATATALISILYNLDLLLFFKKPFVDWKWLEIISIISFLSLLLTAVFCCCTVWPRTSGSKKGVVFFGAIAESSSSEKYSQEFFSHHDNRIVGELVSHIYDLAVVCRTKYNLIRYSCYFGAAGFLFYVLLFVASKW